MIYYRALKKYKYQLMRDYQIKTGITNHILTNNFLQLNFDGLLIIRAGYAWDGASGPAIDTNNIMRGSLVHDALYQLMRDGVLWQKYRIIADKLLKQICIEDGMSKPRANLVYYAVRLGAGWAAKPGTQKEEIFTAP